MRGMGTEGEGERMENGGEGGMDGCGYAVQFTRLFPITETLLSKSNGSELWNSCAACAAYVFLASMALIFVTSASLKYIATPDFWSFS